MDNSTAIPLSEKTSADLAAQGRVLAAFSATLASQTYEDVMRIDTHASVIFLAGLRAYKIKRAVRYPYLDYSSCAKREAACRREFDINQAMSPDLYIGYAPLVRQADETVKLCESGPYDPVSQTG